MFKPTKTRAVMRMKCMPETLLYMRYIDDMTIREVTKWFNGRNEEIYVSVSTMGNILRYSRTIPKYRRILEECGYVFEGKDYMIDRKDILNHFDFSGTHNKISGRICPRNSNY